jgi:hypothetical protein
LNIFLNGYIDQVNFDLLKNKTQSILEFGANNLQYKVIQALKKSENFDFLSCPFLPKKTKKFIYNEKTKKNHENIIYLNYIEFPGLFLISRFFVILNYFFKINKTSRIKKIIVYSSHFPFILSSYFFKLFYPSVKLLLIIPDLPQYMHVGQNKSVYYKILKKLEFFLFKKLIKRFDKFWLLNENMINFLDLNIKKCIIKESLFNQKLIYSPVTKNNYRIAYSGKLVDSFGIKDLISWFENLSDAYNKYELHVIGVGELTDFLKKKSRINKKIHYYGQLNFLETQKILSSCFLLLNPRKINSPFVKYSFPSKILDYIALGRPVASTFIPGINKEYEKFLYFLDVKFKNPLQLILSQIENENMDYINQRIRNSIDYINFSLLDSIIIKEFLNLVN